MSARFRIKTLTTFPCPEMALECIIIPTFGFWYISPVFSGIFLGSDGKNMSKLLKCKRRNQTVFRLVRIVFATFEGRLLLDLLFHGKGKGLQDIESCSRCDILAAAGAGQ
jgi:hypothetical protein